MHYNAHNTGTFPLCFGSNLTKLLLNSTLKQKFSRRNSALTAFSNEFGILWRQKLRRIITLCSLALTVEYTVYNSTRKRMFPKLTCF